MPDYTKYKRGSEWRKWDLHIHTPETKKNDQFAGANAEEKWQKYIDEINSSPEKIAVIGITDYFCIENYFSFKKYISEGKITKKFEMVIPNIEIRVVPVTGSATSINMHCIFNPLIDSEIETRFLSKLKFHYGNSDYSAQKNELIRLGKALPGNEGFDNIAALKAGVGQYVISMESLREVFEKDNKLRENTIIVVSNKSNDGASGIRNHTDYFIGENSSQLDATRYSIYQFADAIFSSNEADILYFLGHGPDKKETVIEKCNTLMPCFHGCDAHSNDKIFKPAQSRFCWIKADPTFEGLKQTLYEPEDRVKVQALKPDIKNDRFIISELKYVDTGTLFGNQSILLNENLNAIIGGKSSGKSLLLYSTASSIDPEQVERTSKRLSFEGYKFDYPYDFEVTWKNGEKDLLSDKLSKNHKIIYIPQLYINYLVEKNNKEDLNTLIENILLQDPEFKKFFDNKTEQIYHSKVEIDKIFESYLQIRTKALTLVEKSKELGKSDTIQKSVEKIEAVIKEGQKNSNLSEEEFKTYNQLILEKGQAEKELKDLNDKEILLQKIYNEISSSSTELLGEDGTDGFPIRGRIDSILDEIAEVPADVQKIIQNIGIDLAAVLNNLKTQIDKLNIATNRDAINKKIIAVDEKLKPFLLKIAGQKELEKLTKQLESEKLKVQQALTLEKQIKSLQDEYKNSRNKTIANLKKRHEYYKEIQNQINSTKNNIGSEITLNCSLLAKQEDFLLFEQVNKSSLSGDSPFYNLFTPDGLVKYDEVLKLYGYPLKMQENKLIIDKDIASIPLRQRISIEEVLRGFISDLFRLDYTVTYKGDDLLSMSPGKKGTVLLILFLQLNSSEYPILIDQPEDNLDNRTIYDLLCKMIKLKKRERQIIIVSHNANLVVATDTENIIVANQSGQDSVLENQITRFEYVNGSLEHSFAKVTTTKAILLSQGIKEHVCDILEGGDEAFKQRERKYAIKN
jgi:hypothetical protein